MSGSHEIPSLPSGLADSVPELSQLLQHLKSRSLEACSSACLDNHSEALATVDRQLELLRAVDLAVSSTVAALSLQLGAQRNKFCKINTLPVEILREILLEACEYGLRWGTLLKIVRICKLWHDVLSSDPAAYSTIGLSGGGAKVVAETFAERSNPLLLNVVWPRTEEMKVWKSAFCIRHIHRIRALELALPEERMDQWLLALPAPRLERMRLISAPWAEGRGDLQEPIVAEDNVYPQLFGGRAPELRVLELWGCRLAWCPGNYSNLTSLQLGLTPEHLRRNNLDSHDIFVIFWDSPNLAYLDICKRYSLEDKFYRDPTARLRAHPPTIDQPRYLMRHLRSLSLHLPHEYIIEILQAIQISTGIRTIKLRIDDEDLSDPNDERLTIMSRPLLSDFLFNNIVSFEIVSGIRNGQPGSRQPGPPYRRVTGVGYNGPTRYTFQVDLPPASASLLPKHLATIKSMPELRYIGLQLAELDSLLDLMACYPGISEVDVYCDCAGQLGAAQRKYSGARDSCLDTILGELTRLIREHPVALAISRWELGCGLGWLFLRPDQAETLASLATLRHLSTGRDFTIVLQGVRLRGDVHTLRRFLVELAHCNVILASKYRFDVEEPCSRKPGGGSPVRYVDSYESVEELWPEGVPEEVRKIASG